LEVPLTTFPADHQPWTEIPTELLRAELLRRADGDTQPECGSGKTGHYNTGLHVFALFLILGVSTLGTSHCQ